MSWNPTRWDGRSKLTRGGTLFGASALVLFATLLSIEAVPSVLYVVIAIGLAVGVYLVGTS